MELNEYKDLFVDETADLLKKIESGLIGLEQDEGSSELVNEIFRALHTIKGSGAMFGFNEVSEFAHVLENLFDEIRKGKLKVKTQIIDIGLRSLDCINSLMRNEGDESSIASIIAEISQFGQQSVTVTNAPLSTTQKALPKSEDPGGKTPKVWRITLKPDSKILHRGVRIEPLFEELAELGNCHVLAEVDQIEDLESLEPTEVYLTWVATLSSNRDLVEIRSVFMFVEDYCELSFDPVEIEPKDGNSSVPKIGEILVDRGIIRETEVEEIIQGQKAFGEVALSSGKIRKEHIEAALAEQDIVRTIHNERDSRKENSTIRVKKEKLDVLIDLVGELVILQAMLDQESKKLSTQVFNVLSESLGRLAGDLRESTMKIRMVPLEESFTSYQRLIRDLAKQLNKEIQLEVSGTSTELDKNVIEELKDPIVHILRNSADHGIESPELREQLGKPRMGTIKLGAQQVGSRVEISISDDGGGLNLERIKERAVERGLLSADERDEHRINSMIFEPGFSTAVKTTGISGRGVGMDVVKRNVENLRGEINVSSLHNKGTTITISIPLTLVIIEGLIVQIEGHDYVIILSQVQECVDLDQTEDLKQGKDTLINIRGMTVPVISLCERLGLKKTRKGMSRVVVVNIDGSTYGLLVDSVIGRRQVVIKPLSKSLQNMKVISGATIMGDGTVGLIIDINEVVRKKISSGTLSFA